MKAKLLTNLFILVGIFAGFLFLFLPSTANAAINGENGPIVYIENNTIPEKDISEEPQNDAINNQNTNTNKVITTDSQGDNQQTAAETEDTITAVGISPPKSDNNYDIAYATETYSEEDCTVGEVSCAKINKVTVNSNGTPTGPSQPLATINSLFEPNESSSLTRATNLSYSPDAQNILATIFSWNTQENLLSAVYQINNNTGSKTTIVTPRSDPCLNAGYADNGNIFYSMLNQELAYYLNCQDLNNIDSEVNFQSDIYVQKPGQAPINLTNTENISEFFIDVSSDNKFVLVADTNTYDGYWCNYALNFFFKDYSYWPFDCSYYLVNTETGELTQLFEMPYTFIPAYFAPDNTSLIGTNWPLPQVGLRSFVDTNLPYTATLNLATMQMTALTNTLGVQQWSPRIAQNDSHVPVQTITAPNANNASSIKTLPATGINSYVLIGLAMLLITTPVLAYIKLK